MRSLTFSGPGIHFPGKITLKTGDKVYIDKDALVFGQIFAENADDVHIFGNRRARLGQ